MERELAARELQMLALAYLRRSEGESSSTDIDDGPQMRQKSLTSIPHEMPCSDASQAVRRTVRRAVSAHRGRSRFARLRLQDVTGANADR